MAYRHWAEVTGRELDRAPTVVVFTVQDLENGGAFLTALDINGSEVASIWLGSLALARQWAKSEYADGDLGPLARDLGQDRRSGDLRSPPSQALAGPLRDVDEEGASESAP